MKKRIMTLMAGMLLLLTACGQTGSNSASTMLPVAAVQSAAQAVTPMEDKMQEDVDSLPAEEDTEEAEPAGDEETPKPTKDAATPSGKTEETLSTPAGEEQPDVPEQPTTPEQPVTPEPEPVPVPAPTPAEKQEEQPAPTPEPTPTPKPAASGNIYSIAEAIQAGNEYARAQYGVTIDTGMTAADSSFFPGTADSVAWLAENGGQAALTAAVKGNVDATFACLAAMDGAETVSAYARFNCTARYDAASDEYIVVVLYG